MRRLYAWLLRLHPPAFRNRFRDELLAVYDQAVHSQRSHSLVWSATVSLVRQWIHWALLDRDVTAAADPLARAMAQHHRLFALESRFTLQYLTVLLGGFALDSRLWHLPWLALPTSVFVLGLARFAWLQRRRRHDDRCYVDTFNADPSGVRWEVERRLATSHPAASTFLVAAGASALLSIPSVSAAWTSRGRVSPLWTMDVALMLTYLLGAGHHRALAKVLERELTALDELSNHSIETARPWRVRGQSS